MLVVPLPRLPILWSIIVAPALEIREIRSYEQSEVLSIVVNHDVVRLD